MIAIPLGFFRALPLLASVVMALVISAPTSALASGSQLTYSDELEIARMIAFDMVSPTNSGVRRKHSISIELAEEYQAGIQAGVAEAYIGWRIVAKKERFTKNNCFFDRTTNGPSIGIGVGFPVVVIRDTVEVQAGSAVCVIGSNGYKYRLRKEGGAWAILDRKMEYIV